jgi:hypothetical protein
LRSTRRRCTAFGVVLALLLASGQNALAAEAGNRYSWKLPELQQDKSVPTTSVAAPAAKTEDRAAKAAVTKIDPAVWPGESQADIDLSGVAAVAAKSAPGFVSLQRKDSSAATKAMSPAKVRVNVKGQDAAKKLGLNGVVFTVGDAGGATGES